MNIIIPLGGKGERFSKKGYTEPKPLIKIFEKPMILYVLDNLKVESHDKIFIIYYNINSEDIERIVLNKYPNVIFIELTKQTKGASETIYIGLSKILALTNYKKTLILDCDTFYTEDVITMYRKTDGNAVFYVNNIEKNPIYSYINLDSRNRITEIIEKVKISDNANTGIYCFNDINELYNYSKKVVDDNILFNDECYISCIIYSMINDNHEFIGIKLESKYVFNLGTPSQLENYINKTNLFLFDLDGTIILTDNIYYNIWTEILSTYNIKLTNDIYNEYIFGNSDSTVVSTLLNNYDNIDITNLSIKKDELFIKNINEIKLIDGVVEFIKQVKKEGHKLSIVTNCNRKVCEYILKQINIHDIIDTIIIGNECVNSKPYPEPYQTAIDYFNSTSEKAIIFEDSKTGLLSANGVCPKSIIGIETHYTNYELNNYNIEFSIKDYLNCNVENFVNLKDNTKINTMITYIKNSIKLDISGVIINKNKLKGGFISDVIEVTILTKNQEKIDCVLKLENTNETFLTEMSHKLDLYNREYYFYDTICKNINISFPKSIGIVKDNNFMNIGILMENLNKNDYILNLNLNIENIDTSLKIIDSLAKLHSKFWNKQIKHTFRFLKKNNECNIFWNEFINSKWHIFKKKWLNMLSLEQINKGEYIVNNFNEIEENLSNNNLTLCHGDVKSANIFYKKISGNSYECYFIDWQYIIIGKGVQDLVFFMIESFDIDIINKYKTLFKEYYYIKLLQNGIKYDKSDYEKDFQNASYYFPFFVAIWFGTINEDELIDKTFPIEFIKKLFNFYIDKS